MRVVLSYQAPTLVLEGAQPRDLAQETFSITSKTQGGQASAGLSPGLPGAAAGSLGVPGRRP